MAAAPALMNDLKTTARITGLCYLGLAITGALGFLMVRSVLFVPGDSAATAKNLLEQTNLARFGVAMELAISTTQALAAIWFFKLFRSINSVAAGSLAAFGFVNSVAILASTVLLATALSVISNASLAPGNDVAATVQLLYEASGKIWSLGGVFFGLWLIPMGHATVTSGRMPKVLGWLLIVGGLGYVLGAFLAAGFDTPQRLTDFLAMPATIGELWMIGYLLSIGIRPEAQPR